MNNLTFAQKWQLLASHWNKSSKHNSYCSWKNCLKLAHIFLKYQLKPNQELDDGNCYKPTASYYTTYKIDARF